MYDLSWQLTVILITLYCVIANVRKGRKQAAHKFNVERFNLRKLNDLEVRKEYHIKMSNRLADFENLNDSEEIKRV
jgi:hypothetical protein